VLKLECRLSRETGGYHHGKSTGGKSPDHYWIAQPCNPRLDWGHPGRGRYPQISPGRAQQNNMAWLSQDAGTNDRAGLSRAWLVGAQSMWKKYVASCLITVCVIRIRCERATMMILRTAGIRRRATMRDLETVEAGTNGTKKWLLPLRKERCHSPAGPCRVPSQPLKLELAALGPGRGLQGSRVEPCFLCQALTLTTNLPSKICDQQRRSRKF